MPAFAANPKILIYGDSLSAAYGIPQQQGWAALLKEKLDRENLGFDVINASISGETTSGGLTRLARTLEQTKPQTIIIELGANDGLRGLPVKNMRDNLEAMIQLSKTSGAKVLLVGMRIPPNYGPKYTEEFSQTYIRLAKQHKIRIVPFMLENVAAKPGLIQQDGLHPNALGQPIVLENIWPELQRLIKKRTR
jgi:acyl-CoA thioesterase-1